MSPDSKLIAIGLAYPREGILIYDIVTQELRQILEGCGTLAFRPRATRRDQGAEGETATDDFGEKPVYTLVSSFSTSEQRPQPYSGIILWELDCNGRLFVEEEPIDPAAMATKAIEAIIPALESEHEWTHAFVEASNLHADFVQALEKTSADHRRRNNTVIQKSEIPNFVKTPFSHGGNLLLYVANNRTTQHGMRDPDDLPHVIVYDVDPGQEVHRFRGHTDLVAWATFSPDDLHVASASWDGTLRMCSIETGELEWATADSGGQSLGGAFSPDSKHIVWSSHSGKDIRVLNVADGKVLSTFPETVTRWCRCFSWHPTEQQIALCADKTVYVWQPFDGPGGTLVQRMVIDYDDRFARMDQISQISWMDDGRLLAVGMSDRTILVYDTLRNAKEVFKRPRGVAAAFVRPSFYELPKDGEGRSTYLSVDGDGKVRYWDRSVAPEVQSQQESAVASSGYEKPKESPKNGRYVGVMSRIKDQIRGAKDGKEPGTASDEEREAWAQKGTSIWTAE
jgi:hypothetical protein